MAALARRRNGQFMKRSHSRPRGRSLALVRSRPQVINIRPSAAPKKRSTGRRRRHHSAGLKATVVEKAKLFGASAVYGYIRGGNTQNLNEVLDKVPGGDVLGVDLRNAVVFYLANKYFVRSPWLDKLVVAAVCRSGDTFGAAKFAHLSGYPSSADHAIDGDVLSGEMD